MPKPVADDPGGANRRRLLAEVGRLRESDVISYVLSDRQGAAAQVAEDAIRPLYDHLRTVGRRPRVDLFLYSTGGFTDVPWRIVTMIREYAEHFGVLVPYRAMSAATMIALGADEIVMGPKGELGPIDPQLGIQRGREGETPVQEQIAVEDIMSYIRLLRDRVGLTDQAAIAPPMAVLAEKLDPWILGAANRSHSHIRDVARKLLTARRPGETVDEQRLATIIEMLAEKTYQHGHAIGRKEAAGIGLRIIEPEADLEAAIWSLLEGYEDLCEMRDPVDAESALGDDDARDVPAVFGAIESVSLAHRFPVTIRLTRNRQMPPNLNLNLQLALNLPAGIDPASIPQEAQEVLRQLLEQTQRDLPGLVQEEVRRQAPALAIQGRVLGQGWRPVEGWLAKA